MVDVRASLEEHLMLNREDATAWLAYREVMLEAGLPPGEVMALEDNVRPGLTQNAVFEHRAWYWGEAWELAKHCEIGWAHGFAELLALMTDARPEWLVALLDAPATWFLSTLRAHQLPAALMDALLAQQRPLLQLMVKERWAPERTAWSLPRIVEGLPLLEGLDMPHHGFVLDGAHPALQLLCCASVSGGVALPALELLEIGDELSERWDTPGLTRALVEGRFPALRELRLQFLDDVMVRTIVESPAAAQLESLRSAWTTDDAARLLIASKARLLSLTKFNRGRGVQDPALREALGATFRRRA